MSKIYWQAHRGGAFEMPQNTIVSAMYGWNLGAIVEVDIRTTKDNQIIVLHNSTLEETTNAGDDIKDIDVSELTYEEISKVDAGVKFDDRYKGQKVPKLSELFEIMQKDKNKQVYLDLKNVNLKQLSELITEYNVVNQCIFCHCDVNNCLELKSYIDIRCMLWIGGTEEQIKEKFETIKNNNFKGVDQIQLHLNTKDEKLSWMYDLDEDFIKYSLAETRKENIDLELFPWVLNKNNVFKMLDLGAIWFCTDYPKDFKNILLEYNSISEEVI